MFKTSNDLKVLINTLNHDTYGHDLSVNIPHENYFHFNDNGKINFLQIYYIKKYNGT